MSEVADFLTLLEGVRGREGQWTAKCPNHHDRSASLSVSEGREGNVLAHCHAGCTFEDIVAAAGFQREQPAPTEPAHGHVLASYEYHDENGELLYVVERRAPRGFLQRRPAGDGTWVWRLGNVRRVPYRLPELITGVSENRVIFVVEGEKDADTLHRHGLVATTNAGGAGWDWPGEWAQFFVGARVCVLPDNDTPGLKAATKRARLLSSVAAVRLVELPGLPDKGDVTDWIETQGHTVQELRELYMQTPLWGEEQAKVEASGIRLNRLSKVKRTKVEWLWSDRIAKGKLTLLAGDPGTGKSYLSLALAAAVTRGAALPDGNPVEKGRVVLVAYEDDSSDTIAPRFDALGGDDDLIDIVDHYVDDDGERTEFSRRHVPELIEAVKSMPDTRLIIIDPVMSFVGGRTDAHRDNEVRAALAPLVTLAEQVGIAVLGIVHFNKGDAEKALHRVGGSVAFTAVARAVLLAGKHPDSGRRAVAPLKNNLGDDQVVPIEYQIGPEGLLWVGEAPDLTVEVLTAPRRRDTEEQTAAATWLESYLATGPRTAKDLYDDADAEGHSRSAIQWARRQLGKKISVDRIGSKGDVGKGAWVWEWQD